MSHDRLLLLHPVLRPGGGLDYNEECDFGLDIPADGSKRTAEGLVRVEASFVLVSSTLQKMIKEGKARYLVLSTCSNTYYRDSTSSDTQEVVIEIPAKDLAGTLKLTPYVVATEDLEWFVAPEHVPEIKEFQGKDKIPRAAILAIGASHEIELDQIGTIWSAIKIIRSENIEEGRYAINTVGDFIVIELANKTYVDVVRMKGQIRDVLYSSIYQAAIEYSLRKMTEEANTKWAKALQKTLEERDISGDDIEENANHYAQVIMGNPLGQMIDWCSRSVSFD